MAVPPEFMAIKLLIQKYSQQLCSRKVTLYPFSTLFYIPVIVTKVAYCLAPLIKQFHFCKKKIYMTTNGLVGTDLFIALMSICDVCFYSSSDWIG